MDQSKIKLVWSNDPVGKEVIKLVREKVADEKTVSYLARKLYGVFKAYQKGFYNDKRIKAYKKMTKRQNYFFDDEKKDIDGVQPSV